MDRGAVLLELLGTPYDRAERHCGWLAARVQRDLFGRDLPAAMAAFAERHERAALLKAHPARSAWQQVDHPADGDMVLMARVPGKDIHCGVYLVGRGIIHTDEPHGVVIDSELDLREVRRWRITYHRPI